MLKGNIKKFPFDKGGGEFLTWIEVTDGTLAYLPKWPLATNVSGKIVFKNEGMFADITSAEVLNNKIYSGHISIPNFRRDPRLDITALKTQGKLSQQVKFIRQSPLGQNIKDFLDKSKFSGTSKLEVAIHAPLKKEKLKKENIEVEGKVELQKNSVIFSSINQKFNNVSGTASFTQDGISAKKINAQYKQAPATISLSTSKNKKNILLSLKQSNTLQQLFNKNLDFVEPVISGKTSYTAKLKLPSYSLKYPNKDKSINLEVNSNLIGLQSKLPEPFNKQENKAVPLKVSWSLPANKKQTSSYLIHYGDLLSAIFSNNEKLRLGILLGKNQKPQLPSSGINIRGTISRTNLLHWKKLLGNNWKTTNKALSVVTDIQIKQLLLAKQNQGKARFQLHKNNSNLSGNLTSSKLQVNFNKQKEYWNIQLANLNTDILAAEPTNKSTAMLPKDFPSVYIQCSHCSSKGLMLDKLKLKLQKQGNKSNINLIEIVGKNYHFSASGNWLSTNSNSSYTRLKIQKAEMTKPEEFLASMGNDIGIKGAKTTITGKLAWQGSPLDFSLNKLSGDIHVAMQKGQLNDIQAGAGKLLGLLNISKLSRRLRFDFSDVSGKGLLFDRISGDIKINNGVVNTQNTVIESSVMLAGIKGKSDLVHKTHDQTITIIPDVKSALPALGLLFGGVGVGAAVATLDKLTQKSERSQLNNKDVAGTRYRVTGTWKDPVISDITPVGQPEDIYGEGM